MDLNWKTATELKNSHFEVQRSADGQNFENISRVYGNGTISQVISYDFTDTNPFLGKNYYRLKQVILTDRINSVRHIKYPSVGTTN